MRYIFPLFFGYLCLVNFRVDAQTYHPFPTDSAFWKIHEQNNEVEENYETIEMVGDTLLSGVSYSKLFKTSFLSIHVGNFDSTHFYSRSFYGGLREESKVIYFYDPATSLESVVFNFNWGVGDTVGYSWAGFYLTISTIDSVQMLDGSFRKRYNFPSVGYSTEWYIEGVGNDWGILPNYTSVGGPGAFWSDLTCFSQLGTVVYFDPNTGEDCDILTSVNSNYSTSQGVQISNNPFSDKCKVKFGNLIHKGTMTVVDAEGKIFIQKSIRDSESEIISKENLGVPGIYFLIFNFDGEILFQKLVYVQ